jgi:hypothetical protein
VSYERLFAARSISGHVFRKDRASGPVWYAKYRLPDGRQVQKKIAPAWTRPGRPADGYVNRRGAEAWLADVLAQAHAGTLPGMVRTGVTFSRACEERLRYCVEDRACKPSTMVDYRHGGAGAGAGVRGVDAGGGDGADDRGVARVADDGGPDAQQAADDPQRDLPAGAEALRAAAQPRDRARAHARAATGQPRRVQPGGSAGAGAGGGERAGRRDLPDRGVHGVAPRRADRAALARRRLRRLGGARASKL